MPIGVPTTNSAKGLLARMFSAKTIAIAFVSMFAGTFLLMLSVKLKQRWLEIVGLVIVPAASLFCVAAALFLWGDWQDPFASANVSAEQLGRAAGSHRGRGGIVILAIKFWPYVLGGLGAYFAYNTIGALLYEFRSSKTRRLRSAIDSEVESLQAAHDSLGKTLEDSATMMDGLVDEFSDNPEIAARLRELADDARKE